MRTKHHGHLPLQALKVLVPTLVLVLAPTLPAGAAPWPGLTVPAFPSWERTVYAERIGTRKGTLEQSLELRQDQERTWYELRVTSTDADSSYRLDPRTLFSTYADTTTTQEDATVRRTTEFITTLPTLKDHEIAVADFVTMPTTLRAFPWAKGAMARLVFLGNATTNAYGFEFKVLGTETIKIGTTPWECWKAELALGGILGTFVGKNTFWYSTKPPHVLVKLEGATGGPGSPVRVLELQDYRSRT